MPSDNVGRQFLVGGGRLAFLDGLFVFGADLVLPELGNVWHLVLSSHLCSRDTARAQLQHQQPLLWIESRISAGGEPKTALS